MPEPVVVQAAGAECRLHNQDCVQGMAGMPAGTVSVIVTSPPYNLGIKYAKYDDTLPRDKYLDWTEAWLKEARRVLADDGSLFLNVAGMPSDPWGPFDVLMRARELFQLQNVIHWVKSIHIPKEAVGKHYGILNDDLTVGHYKPVNSPRFLNDCHEYVFHLTKSGDVAIDRLALGVPYQDKSNVKRWKSAGKDKHCRGNTWFIPYKTIQRRDKERPHPASYPIELAEMCIKLHGLDKCELVLDPFLGIGNTAVACARNEVNCVGFEIDEGYLAEAERRLREESTGALQFKDTSVDGPCLSAPERRP